MKALVLIFRDNRELIAVARTKIALNEWRKRYNAADILAWRYHDGSGWADGSPDAWQHVNVIVGKLAKIVI